MDKKSRAKLLLIELASLQEADSEIQNILTLINEALRDAKALAEDVIKEEAA